MLLEVGRVAKPHGVRGQVIVEVTSNRPERWVRGTRLSTSEGPLEITNASPAPPRAGGDRSRWIVTFAGIHDREGAEVLRDRVLCAEPLDDPDAIWVHDLIGAEVVEISGRAHGAVVSVQANPASDLLVLASGALVPLRFVVDRQRGQVIVDAPDGLFDL